MRISREVSITETWLNHQAQLMKGSFPPVSARVWASELAKAAVWFMGLVLLLLGMALLAPESRADSVTTSQVAAELDTNSALQLAVGVDIQLANNLIRAQNQTWGKEWQLGSLDASIEAVLRAITLYVWPGGPAVVTNQREFPIVWDQSRVAIDTGLSVVFSADSIYFGEQPVATLEPGTLIVLLAGLAGLGTLVWIVKRDVRELSQ